MRSITRLAILALSAALWLQPGLSHAGSELYDDTISTCTGINCSSVRLPGTIFSFGSGAGAWVGQVYARPGECVRLDVAAQVGDLAMAVIAPNGTVFYNDDRPGDTRPLVAIAGTPNNGWYTVRLAHFAGNPVEGNFALLYGRYTPANNPNCADGTFPLSAVSLQAGEENVKPDNGIRAPRPGAPGSED